jgi:hypothetical protein
MFAPLLSYGYPWLDLVHWVLSFISFSLYCFPVRFQLFTCFHLLSPMWPLASELFSYSFTYSLPKKVKYLRFVWLSPYLLTHHRYCLSICPTILSWPDPSHGILNLLLHTDTDNLLDLALDMGVVCYSCPCVCQDSQAQGSHARSIKCSTLDR